MAKRPRHVPPPRQTRTRTRQSKSTLAGDPTQNTEHLNEQLRALGLYPAPTLGDGNCLFRALSDQFYGSPSQHLKLREEICSWMDDHKARYAPFCDDERGLDVHLRCMRQPGTYGGHLELTAFAHLKRRDVKVIQPGLVYVIEWTSGADLSPTLPHAEPHVSDSEDEDPPSQPKPERDARKTRRERKKEQRAQAVRQRATDTLEMQDDEDESSSSLGAVYVAYHDWEHYSSVRMLSGPHAGLPNVVEKPATMGQAKSAARSQAREKKEAKQTWDTEKPESQSSQSSLDSSSLTDVSADLEADQEEPDLEHDHIQDDQGLLSLAVPLPMSRTPSPPPSSETSASQSTSGPSQTGVSLPLLPGYNCPADYARLRLGMAGRNSGSPKRTYDNTDEGADDSQGEAKRSRRNSIADLSSKPTSRVRGPGGRTKSQSKLEFELDGDGDLDLDADTPDLLSSAESSSNDGSSSPALTPPPSTVVVPPTPTVPQTSLSHSPSRNANTGGKTLSKRQRKRLGLPKSSAGVADVPVGGRKGQKVSAGKIKVPGGRFKRPDARAEGDTQGGDAAWMTNGSGRVDVRGFKELKI